MAPSAPPLWAYLRAALNAILVANAVFPIDGRPAKINKSEFCKPPSFLSISRKPVVTPVT